MEEHPNVKLQRMTRLIMDKAEGNIEERKEPALTTGQYNAIYEAIQDILDGNI